MSNIPGLNRVGSIQSIANDPTHPNQTLYHSRQEARVYWWLDFWLHLGQIDGANLPHQYDFAPSTIERIDNAKWLEENFTIKRPSKAAFEISRLDPLYDESVQMFVFHSDCMSTIPTIWAERMRIEWGCEKFIHQQQDRTNPLRIAAIASSQPGHIVTEFSQLKQRWAVRIYSQYESGPAIPNRESEVTRVMWFTQCMDQVATFMRKRAVKRVAVPKFIGCSENTQKEWQHYSDVLQAWCEQNADLFLTIYHTT